MALEERQSALLSLNDAIGQLSDPSEIGVVSSSILGKAMGAARVAYGDINADAGTIEIDRDWTAEGMVTVSGVHQFADYGEYLPDILAGRPVVISDVTTDPRTKTDPGPLLALGIHALLDLPLMERGLTVAQIFVHSATPRVWTEKEIAFVGEFAGRTRSAIARCRAEVASQANEARLQFLDALAQATGPLDQADAILAVTTRMVARHFGGSNCAYADMDEDQDGFTIPGDWAAPGSPSIVGHYSLADFGKLAVQELRAGRPLIINDNLTEIAPDEAATFQSIGIAATICMPLVKDGRLAALMAVHMAQPHVWTEAELTLIREVTQRSWAHVERVGVQAALRQNEARQGLCQPKLSRPVIRSS